MAQISNLNSVFEKTSFSFLITILKFSSSLCSFVTATESPIRRLKLMYAPVLRPWGKLASLAKLERNAVDAYLPSDRFSPRSRMSSWRSAMNLCSTIPFSSRYQSQLSNLRLDRCFSSLYLKPPYSKPLSLQRGSITKAAILACWAPICSHSPNWCPVTH